MTSPQDKLNAVRVANWRKRMSGINPLHASEAEQKLFYSLILGVEWVPLKLKDEVSRKGLGISVSAQNAYALQGWARQTRFNIRMRMQRMKQNGERPLMGRRLKAEQEEADSQGKTRAAIRKRLERAKR